MFRVIKKQNATIRKISDKKIAVNYITKEISQLVSLAITEGTDYCEEEVSRYNRIYFLLDGKMILKFSDKEVELFPEDTCFIENGTKYVMKGTFKAIVINQPAFGT